MRRVLVVDDNPDIRELLRQVLEFEGYTVEVVNDGVAALESLLHADDPWVVLLDITMPRMTGLEVCARLSAAGGTAARHIVVLMTAGFFPEGDVLPPVRALLAKPFSLNALYDLVAELATTDVHMADDPDSRTPLPATRTIEQSERLVA